MTKIVDEIMRQSLMFVSYSINASRNMDYFNQVQEERAKLRAMIEDAVRTEPKPAQIPAELVEKINAFPELNMSNYGDDEVTTLNEWGIELINMVKGKS